MTDFLYSKPNYIDGFMSVLDIFGVTQNYNFSKTSEEADNKAYLADLSALQKDMKRASEKVLSCQIK